MLLYRIYLYSNLKLHLKKIAIKLYQGIIKMWTDRRRSIVLFRNPYTITMRLVRHADSAVHSVRECVDFDDIKLINYREQVLLRIQEQLWTAISTYWDSYMLVPVPQSRFKPVVEMIIIRFLTKNVHCPNTWMIHSRSRSDFRTFFSSRIDGGKKWNKITT